MSSLAPTDQMQLLIPKFQSVLRLPLLWLTIGSGVFYYLMLPAEVIVMNDDFGYLGTIVDTLHKGRPWTDEWLEPWSASLAILSAMAYTLTGSFHFAVQGLQAIYAALTAAGVFTLARSRGVSLRTSCLIVLLGLSFPTLFWKFVEFTGLTLYLPCLVWAIWASTQRRWGIFFAVWTIAVASRQSALAWLILPTWAVIAGLFYPSGRQAAWRQPALGLIWAIIAYVTLSSLMNQTHAQMRITQHLLEQMEAAKSFRNFALGLGVGIIFAGLGAIFLGELAEGIPNTSKRFWAIAVILTLGPGLISFSSSLPPIFAEHRSFTGWPGNLYVNLIIAAGLYGLVINRLSIHWDLMCASLAALALVCLRTNVWDYYFADVAIFAFFSVNRPHNRPLAASPHMMANAIGSTAVILFAGFHLFFAFGQKCRIDQDYAACVLSEKALREGRLDVLDLGYAPFGFIGWHLNPYYVANDGSHEAGIGGWMRYLRADAVELRPSKVRFWRDSRSLREIQGTDESRVIASDVFPIGWFWYRRYTLLQTNAGYYAPHTLRFNRSTYQVRRFPLSDLEWNSAIEKVSP